MGGSGGVRGPLESRPGPTGAKVALLEGPAQAWCSQNYSAIGGTCVNVGMRPPKKLMVFCWVVTPGEIAEAAGYGLEWSPLPAKFDWEKLSWSTRTPRSRGLNGNL